MNVKIGKHTIVLSAEVISVLSRHIQDDRKKPESGGIIIGRIVSDVIMAEKLSIPTQLDKATRTTFERHRLSAQIIIDYEHINSYGQMIYLGEWHTHPEDYPRPSSMDIQMIRQQFRENKIMTTFLILLIQGRKGVSVSVINKVGLVHSI